MIRQRRFDGVSILFPLFCAALLSLSLNRCSDADDDPFTACGYTFVVFDPTSGDPADVAMPTDILIDPETGLVRLPLEGEPYDSFNSLDGFSTSAEISIPFDGELDLETLNAESILVVDLEALHPVPINRRAVQYDNGRTVVILEPRLPLKSATSYLVVVTPKLSSCSAGRPVLSSPLVNLLKRQTPLVDEAGNSLLSSLSNEEAALIEPYRLGYQDVWTAAESLTGLGRGDLPFAFTFRTQTLTRTLPVILDRAKAQQPQATVKLPVLGSEAVDLFYQSISLGNIAHDHIGDLYYGSFPAPRYLTHPVLGNFPSEGDDLTEISMDEVPFWAVLPRDARGPVPVVLFLHQFQRAKEDVFRIADEICARGLGVIAVDAVLHGDRWVDFINNETADQLPDGVPDPSGTFFINLQNPRMTRDNIRQTVSDLLVLNQLVKLGNTDFDGDGIAEFDPDHVVYLGSSLGGLVGPLLLAVEPDLDVGVFNVPGARFGKLIPESQEVGASVNEALADEGLFPGTEAYRLFFVLFQSVVDDADPINYSGYMTGGGLSGDTPKQVLVQQMLADTVISQGASEDFVLPMAVPQYDPLLVVEGLPTAQTPGTGSGFYQFADGSHRFLFFEEDGPRAEGLTQALHFLTTGMNGEAEIIDPF